MSWRGVLIFGVVAGWLHAAEGGALPEAPGKKLVLQVCTACHGTGTFEALRLTRNEWRLEVDGMIARGAKADRKQARRIVAYLAAHLGRGGHAQPAK